MFLVSVINSSYRNAPNFVFIFAFMPPFLKIVKAASNPSTVFVPLDYIGLLQSEGSEFTSFI